jgi:hypothetical protein
MANISSYRLGDLVTLNILNEKERNTLVNEHPLSLGAEYLLCNTNETNIAKISRLVMQKYPLAGMYFPKILKKLQ